jgi:guanylate kinase
LSKRGFLLVITAPSGTGKTTVYRKVLERNPRLVFSVSYTTRSKRKNETEGVDYFFIDQVTFRRMKERGEFLEWAVVHNDLYGTEKKQVEKILSKGKICVLDLDVQGALNLKSQYPHAVTVFIKPPSMEELSRRLKKRGTEDEGVVQVRLRNAEKELAYASDFQYIIVNDVVENAVKKLEEVIEIETRKRE